MNKKNTLDSILKDFKNHLEFEKEGGIEDLYFINAASQAKTFGPKNMLEALEKKVLKCTRCSLCQTRTNVVFGAGNPSAELVFVGEAPGYEEDQQGLPFVGSAGQLLTKIIESIGYKRKDVYICNILKCRPPQNRTPLPSEIFACQAYLVTQLDIIKSKIICTLGKIAAQSLLKTDTPITLLRGKFYDYNSIKLIPTFHPAYLLRNPNDKRLVWEDMKKIKRFLGSVNNLK